MAGLGHSVLRSRRHGEVAGDGGVAPRVAGPIAHSPSGGLAPQPERPDARQLRLLGARLHHRGHDRQDRPGRRGQGEHRANAEPEELLPGRSLQDDAPDEGVEGQGSQRGHRAAALLLSQRDEERLVLAVVPVQGMEHPPVQPHGDHRRRRGRGPQEPGALDARVPARHGARGLRLPPRRQVPRLDLQRHGQRGLQDLRVHRLRRADRRGSCAGAPQAQEGRHGRGDRRHGVLRASAGRGGAARICPGPRSEQLEGRLPAAAAAHVRRDGREAGGRCCWQWQQHETGDRGEAHGPRRPGRGLARGQRRGRQAAVQGAQPEVAAPARRGRGGGLPAGARRGPR
mmetsp:Transcript_109388/g.310188  ORF Transcript_109388/g.310188 Transcript_109388/m.310188 type:complete len:342 (-) Transcript_109388:1312-2337(-)